jgi:thiol:disulfide interchange protein DsbC
MTGKWLGALLVLGALLAQTAAPAEQASVDPRVEVASRIPGAKVEQLKATPIPGMYEYTRGTEIAYVTADGKYAISGDLFDLAKNDNLTEQHRRELRSKLIAAVPEDQMLISVRRTRSTRSRWFMMSIAPIAASCIARSPSTTAWACSAT